MYTVIGYERADFKPRDGNEEVKGCNIYLAYNIAESRGSGQAVERVYISDAKAERMGIKLADLIDETVKVYFNRRGKVEAIVAED